MERPKKHDQPTGAAEKPRTRARTSAARSAERTPVEPAPRERESAPREREPREPAPREREASARAPRERAPAERAPRGRDASERAPSERAPSDRAPREREPAPREREPAERAPRDREPLERAPRDRAAPERPRDAGAYAPERSAGERGHDDRRARTPRPGDGRGPEPRGNELRGPEPRGPEPRGPDARHAEARSPDLRGADPRNAESRPGGDGAPGGEQGDWRSPDKRRGSGRRGGRRRRRGRGGNGPNGGAPQGDRPAGQDPRPGGQGDYAPHGEPAQFDDELAPGQGELGFDADEGAPGEGELDAETGAAALDPRAHARTLEHPNAPARGAPPRRGGHDHGGRPQRGGQGEPRQHGQPGQQGQHAPHGRQHPHGQPGSYNKHAQHGQHAPRAHGEGQPDAQPLPKEGTGMLVKEFGGIHVLRQLEHQYLSSRADIFVPDRLVHQLRLREGSVLTGRIGRGQKHKYALSEVFTVDGKNPEELKNLAEFKSLTSIDPDFHYAVGDATGEVSMRILDLLCPVGRGQRGLIVAPPRAGKTTILRQFAKGIELGYPEVHLFVLLVDERPEEATEWKRATKGQVFVSTSDENAKTHVQLAEGVWKRCQRLVETGQDVVLLLDSITRLARAYNNMAGGSGRTMSGGLDSQAMQRPRAIFGSARNTEKAGSLTILGTTLVETGSKMDQLIFEEFKGTGNMELVLSRKLADRRIFPAIDIEKSGTRKDEKLYSAKRYKQITTLRKVLLRLNFIEAMDLLVTKLSDVETNDDFLKRFEVDPEA